MEKRKWLIKFSSNIDAFDITENDNGVCTIFFGENEDTKTKEDAERNAMLIRCAPELLEALKDIIHCQNSPTKTLANLNGAIYNANLLIKENQL